MPCGSPHPDDALQHTSLRGISCLHAYLCYVPGSISVPVNALQPVAGLTIDVKPLLTSSPRQHVGSMRNGFPLTEISAYSLGLVHYREAWLHRHTHTHNSSPQQSISNI
jgi:hypothetical protein